MLEVGFSIRRCPEKKLTVEDLRKLLVEIDASVVAAEANTMRAFNPAYCIHEVVIVLDLELIGGRRGAHLETGQRKFVNGFGYIAHRAIDAQIVRCDGRDVDEAIVNAHQSEAEIIHQRRGKKMCLVDAEKTVVQRDVIGEIQVSSTDATGQGSAERGL